MSTLTQSPSSNNLPTCPYCGTQVESMSLQCGVVRCPKCPRSFWSVNDLESARRELAAVLAPRPNPVWNDQVKIGSGRWDTGAFHRAIAVAVDLFQKGKWKGRGLLVVHDPYQTNLKQEFYREPLVLGVDYEFGRDSVYQGAGPDQQITNYQLRITNGEEGETR